MSSYVKYKVVRLPIQPLLDKLGVDDPWDTEDYLKRKLGDRYDGIGMSKDFFMLQAASGEDGHNNYYIDYVVECDRRCSEGEYGYMQLLNEQEEVQYGMIFSALEISFDIKDLRKICYCYYNCSEPPDYYFAKSDIFSF